MKSQTASPDVQKEGLFAAAAMPSRRAPSIRDVLKALRDVRIREAGLQETEIQERVHAVLLTSFPQAKREVKFGQGCRADIWIDGIVVELKKKRPDRAAVMTQLHRYARQDGVRGVILVLERSILLPEEIEGMSISVLSLNALWGVAI